MNQRHLDHQLEYDALEPEEEYLLNEDEDIHNNPVDLLSFEPDDRYGSENKTFEVITAAESGPGRSSGYACEACSRVFNTKKGLKIHTAAHKRKSNWSLTKFSILY